MPDIQRVASVSILGVTISNRLSVGEHVQSVLSKCAQSMHALKILRSHGMSSDAFKVIYKSVVLTKLLYASPHGGVSPLRLTSNGFKHSCVEESGLTCIFSALDTSVSQCVLDTNDELFSTLMANSATSHVTSPYLSSNLRPRRLFGYLKINIYFRYPK